MKNIGIKSLCLCTAAVAGIYVGSASFAEEKAAQPAAGAQPAMQLPPGWTEQDMQKAMAASMPGKEHQQLATFVGNWKGPVEMTMAPGAPSMSAEMVWTIVPLYDGRFIQTDVKGEWPGMGPFTGHGITGYDNVKKTYVSTWIDNWGTAILTANGSLSPDGKTCKINYTMMCPLTDKEQTIKQTMVLTDAKTLHVEMQMTEPKSGKEYVMLKADLKRD